MTEHVTVILHWNTDYAEIPRAELPNVVKLSFEPMISAIESWKEGTICCNITGHTLEYLLKEAPELIDRIKTLVEEKAIEMLASGYSHPILPLLPRKRVETQLKDHVTQLQKLFGRKPKGFWPPELAVSPSVLAQIQEQGIEWTTIDYEHYLLSQHFGNDINLFERRKQTVTEVLAHAYWQKGLAKLASYWKGYRCLLRNNKEQNEPLRQIKLSKERSMKAYMSSVSWTNSTQFAVGGTIPIYNTKKHLKLIRKNKTKVVPLYGSDIEFFGYRELGATPAKPKALIEFLQQLRKYDIETTSPSDFPDDFWQKEVGYISAGSWAPDKSFRLWTDSEDNTELIRRTNEIYTKLRQSNWDKKLMQKVEPLLRILENSDPRGWAPIPERKDEAYSAMLKIFEILDL